MKTKLRSYCRAISRSTEKQCSNKALRGTEYCWVHYPKRAPIITLFLGALLSLGLRIAYDSVSTSQEERLVVQLSEKLKPFEQLAGSFYPNIDRQEGLRKLVGDFSLLRGDVYLEVSLACHRWRNLYMSLGGLWASNQYDGQFADAWEMLEKVRVPTFSMGTWEHYSPLFTQGSDALRVYLDKIETTNANLLPPGFRRLIIESRRTIETQQMAYRIMPEMIERVENKDAFFEAQFRQMVRVISKLCREADKLREREQQSHEGGTGRGGVGVGGVRRVTSLIN